jgi:hypothetical protein
MARFQFALSSSDEVSHAGTVQSESFAEALELLGERITVTEGDTLEIGVRGFPPARFQCMLSLDDGDIRWRPATALAA